MALPTAIEVAKELLTIAEEASTLKKRTRLVLLTPAQMRMVSGRPQLRGSVLKSVERMLHRESVYLLSNHAVYVLAPFGALTKADCTQPDL